MLREALPEIVTGSVPGPKAAELLKRRDAAIPKAMCGTTYPICMGRGEGAMLEDVDGNRFLDWIGGVGVLNIGYSNPEVVEAVKAQADKYFHGIFNVYVHEGYVKLAEMFDETMPCRGDKMKTYFANSGAEADENAIKIAKAYLFLWCIPRKNQPDHGTDCKESLRLWYGTYPGRHLPCGISISVPCTERIHRRGSH